MFSDALVFGIAGLPSTGVLVYMLSGRTSFLACPTGNMAAY